MIKPDPREVLWYDINNILNLEPDMLPHYWTIIIDKLRMLDDNQPRPICLRCNECLDLFEFEDKVYCPQEYSMKREMIDKQPVITSVQKKRNSYPHPITFETLRESINRILDNIFTFLMEPNGYKFDLLDLEGYMFGQPDDGILETMNGDVSKSQVKKRLYSLKNLVLSRLMELREDIRFSSAMRTPSIRIQ